MLDDYKLEQPIVYKVLTKSLKINKYSHAYLFELNGYNKGLDFALAFAKILLCPNHYSNNLKCKDCNQCHNIDKNNYIELKIIDSSGQWIKKEQLEELQRDFSTKSILGNKKVYIINNAEKLNSSASNSLLKFLEEPPEGIYAILVTNNMYQLLNTIISRCQVLSFKKNIICNNDSSLKKIAKYISSDEDTYDDFVNINGVKYIDEIVEYILFFEQHDYESIIYKNKDFLQCFDDRKKLALAFELFVLYYKDVLNEILGLKLQYFNDYSDSINKVSEKNSLESISKKIKIIVDLSMNIKYNLNSNLLMDNLIIKLCGV